jgi:hypothetical protein
MARRRAPQAPSEQAQKKAFSRLTGGRRWRGIHTATHPKTLHDDLRWFMEQELDALSDEDRTREGAPPKLKRLIRATIWLDHHGIAVSDALGSRCVRSLQRFLEDEAVGTPAAGRPAPLETARQLAGTLRAYEKQMLVTHSKR